MTQMWSHWHVHLSARESGRNFKKRMIRLDALNTGELINCFSEAGVTMFAHNDYLKFRRCPHLGGNFDRLCVADLSGGYRSRDALAFDGNTFHGCGAQRLRLGFFRQVSTEPLSHMFNPKS